MCIRDSVRRLEKRSHGGLSAAEDTEQQESDKAGGRGGGSTLADFEELLQAGGGRGSCSALLARGKGIKSYADCRGDQGCIEACSKFLDRDDLSSSQRRFIAFIIQKLKA